MDVIPESADVVRSLPERLNRAETRRVVSRLLDEDDIGAAFLVSQIWGYGRRGYGPHRVRRILSQDHAIEHLRAAYGVLCRDGPISAFATFSGEHRITGLGPAFFTKFMYFADPNRSALVLDEYVADWLGEHAGMKLVLYPARPSAYREYWNLMQRWAIELEIAADEVEQLIFSSEAVTRPRNEWVLEESS
jgi:Putative 8-oxoguanine DNA glycosylase OGG-like protein